MKTNHNANTRILRRDRDLLVPCSPLQRGAALQGESGTGLFHQWTNIAACVVLALRPVFTERKRTQANASMSARTRIKKKLDSRACVGLVLMLACVRPIFSVYYIEITGDPCNLIGSQQCDLYPFALNRTISPANE